MAETFGYAGVGEFEIRHIDFYQPFQAPQSIYRFIPPAVVNDRDVQSVLAGQFDGPANPYSHMRGGHEVDILTAAGFQAEHELSEVFAADFGTVIGVADIPVLAEHALEVTTCQEDRA